MLTLKEWLKLSSDKKSKKYEELSNDDKFKVRQGFYFDIPDDKINTSTPFMQDIDKIYKEYEESKNGTQK